MAQQGDSDTGNSKPRDDDVIAAIKSRDFKTALSLVESFNASRKFVCPNCFTPLYLMCKKYEIREFSPLHIAAEHGHLGLFQYLLDLFFKNIPSAPSLSQDEKLRRKQELILNLRDYKDNTLLHLASKRGTLDIVKLLTDTLGLDPNCTNLNDKSCLHLAAESGQLIVVRYLIEKTGSDLTLIDKEGRCPSYLAAGGGHLNVLMYMLEDGGSDPHFKRQWGTRGRSLTHAATEQGHLHVIKYLIDHHGCNPSGRDDYGITPLHLACQRDMEIVKYLITKANCDPNCVSKDGETCFHFASKWGQLDVVEYLTDKHHHGCNPSGRDDYGITPLHLACQRDMEIVKYLITKANCDPNCVSKDGETCLHFASKWGQLDVVEYLTDKHQCISKKDVIGNTPLHYAAGEYDNLDVVKFLTKNCICDLLATNKNNETALDRAYNTKSISYLNRASANLTKIKIPPTINIFVVGNSGSGKSTLIKAISQEVKSFLKKVLNLKVKGVVPLTPGIVPTTIDHEIFGRANIFDFAGHEEYYASHEMILCQCSHPLVLLVLKISLPLHEVEKQLLYWLAILSNASTNETCKIMHVIIIGSHADRINKSTTSKIENLISTTIKSKANIQYCGLIHFDCRYSVSSGIEQLCLQLSQISQSIRSDLAKNESNESMKLYRVLMGFIKNGLTAIEGAISLSELWKHYQSAASSEDDLNLAWYFYPLPLNNKMIFIQTCQKLNLSGNMLFIPHGHNIEESLLVRGTEELSQALQAMQN